MTSPGPPASLYVHVPICASKCAYCDFFSLPASSLPEDFESGLVRATLERASRLAERFGADGFDTVYIGGGTPTMLGAEALESLLRGIGALASGSRGRGPREWTIEANPDSLGPEGLDIMARGGVTRLSVGVQSLDPTELELLGRRHGREAALKALRAAAERGFKVSADLIAGIPRRKGGGPRALDGLARFARELADAGARHISAYDLSIEEGTALAARREDYDFPDEDEAWEERRLLESELEAGGMRRYEVSNYSARGDECLHNLAYWRMDSYIGAGPGAVSTIALEGGSSLRIEEAESIEGYGEGGRFSAAETPIPLREAAFETMMMSFRTRFGLDTDAFLERFGMRAEELIGETLASWAPRLGAGEAWPGTPAGRGRAGIALDGGGLDLLNRFLGDCLEELRAKFPS